ncbi:MAG: DmsE family decaheme c-type cytochrome [Aquincola sp.]|nr:DmsE family decaheme c-type cytochrome [Aquincola sp.]
MTMNKTLIGLLLAGAAWMLAPALSYAQAAPAASAPAAAPASDRPGPNDYTSKGADTCLGCHDEEGASYSGSALFKTKHAQRGDKRAPFGPGGLQCEACHGPGAAHAAKGSKKKLTINSFKADSFMSVEQRNRACLTCHEGTSRTGWHASTHERAEVACTDCHKIHHPQGDAVLAKTRESEVCFTCHKQQRADFHKTSSHPVRQGKMACSDCHSPHGSTVQGMLAKPTLNQTCYTCHADKRGPVLWEHAPVAEDCSLCHTPHGSVRAAMLNKSPPLLCQQCHSSAGHPSVPRTGAALPANGGTGAIFVIAGSCTNCHTQVHGSNHPSGAKLMR